MKTLTVGSVVARTTGKISGFIEVPAGIDAGTRIPVTIVTGADDGPVLALIAGIHGSEPSPIMALQRVRAELDPAQLHGTVIIVHVANLPSFAERTIYRGPWIARISTASFPDRPRAPHRSESPTRSRRK